MELLLDLLCLCLLCLTRKTLCDENRPKNITVEGGADVVLPCSLSTKENIEFKLFDWRKVAQKDDGLKEVFMYNGGIHYNNGRDGQSEEFKGRVSHFPDELKHGNASIIIRNTKISDSGNYTCDFPKLQPPQKLNTELVVEPKVITVKEDSDVVLPCSLSTKENITSKQFAWKKVAQKYDCQKDLFFYNGGSNNNKNCFPGRVSHFPDELKHGNASIIIRNTKVTDSGVYTCDFPNFQPPQTFYIELVVVGAALKPSVTILDATAYSALLQCEVHGNPKPKVELRNSDGNILHAKVTQVSEREGSFYITLQTTVTKTGTYRCVATQEEIKHQIYAESFVYISGSPTGLIVGLFLLLLLVAGVLAVLVYKGYITLNCNKVITVKEGSDVTLPCYLSTKEDLRSMWFIWQKTDDGQKVFLYDNGDLYSDERPDQSEQFKGRVSHFPDKLKQGNASIIIRNTTRADSGEYRCRFPLIQKHQMRHIKLDVVGPEVIKVEEGSDVTLPCSLLHKDIWLTQFNWKKMSQNDESQMEVFRYKKGELPGQSEQFKGRVSHDEDKLKQGNASITIRNTTRADSGVYRCIVPLIQKPKKFHIKLVVGPKLITVEEGSDVTLPCSLSTKEDIRSTRFVWRKTDDDQMVFLYDKGDLYSDERPSWKFKGRVSHFPDELEKGNASITIRNTTRADSGDYRCMFPLIEKPQTFYVKLHVGPKIIKVEEGSDVTLPCSLSTKEDLRLTQFIWKKVSQKTDDGQKVFLYDNGDLYSDERPGQSEKFKGRVSHFPDELKQGNASIIIGNTTRADSGDYRCIVDLQKPQKFYFKLLVVEPKLITVKEGSDVTLPCSLWPKKDIQLTRFFWEKPDDDQKVFLYDKGDLYSDGRPGQSEKFKGRVSHFPDKLEQGNASIIIGNTTRADSGDYICRFPFTNPPQTFYIKLDVVDPTNDQGQGPNNCYEDLYPDPRLLPGYRNLQDEVAKLYEELYDMVSSCDEGLYENFNDENQSNDYDIV